MLYTSHQSALVEIWHSDAEGVYSAYPDHLNRAQFDTLAFLNANVVDGHAHATNDTSFLRDAQTSDASGKLVFETIFPGWYDLRVPHIHLKVFVEDTACLTTQLYFPEEFSDHIYSNHEHYIAYGPCPYRQHNDRVLSKYRDARGLLVTPEQDGQDLVSSVRLALS